MTRSYFNLLISLGIVVTDPLYTKISADSEPSPTLTFATWSDRHREEHVATTSSNPPNPVDRAARKIASNGILGSTKLNTVKFVILGLKSVNVLDLGYAEASMTKIGN